MTITGTTIVITSIKVNDGIIIQMARMMIIKTHSMTI